MLFSTASSSIYYDNLLPVTIKNIKAAFEERMQKRWNVTPDKKRQRSLNTLKIIITNINKYFDDVRLSVD